MITIIFLIAFITIVYYLTHLNHQYWQKRGVKGPKPTFLVGNLGKSFFIKAHPGEIYADIYRKYNKETIVGIFKSFTPVLLIRDPGLIKEITTKSFNHFHDNDIDIDKNADPLFGRNPLALKGEEWKIVRAQLTPGFTSGKMKWLYPYLIGNGKKMVKFLESQPDATNGKGYEGNELSTRFTLNNIGDSVFGIEAKCFDEDNTEFRQLVKEFLSPGSKTVLVLFVAMIFPVITKIVSIRFCTKAAEEKLTNIVAQALKHREDNNIVRNDFLHMLSQLKKTCKDYEFTDVDVTAHAAGFFGDGYETSAVVMSFVLYQLSVNPEAQSKLRDEIVKAFDDNEDTLPYETLQSLTYLESVLLETLRIFPPVYYLPKVCTEDFTYIRKDNTPLVIEKGTSVIFSISGLQADPQYFEDPEIFKPERFLGGNKDKIKKCTFLPFGEGQRACLGKRFGLLQIKVGLSYIVKNFEISLNKRTKLPLKFDPTVFLITPIGGLWFDFNKLT